MTEWQWHEAEVDRTSPHFRITYGDVQAVGADDMTAVALVGRPEDGVFPVEFLFSPDDGDPEMISKVRRELDFYLVEKGEEDPWEYAVYHCGTASNVYSPVHWSAHTGFLPNWNEEEIPIAHSRGGVVAVWNPIENLIRPSGIQWPPAEIVQKMYRSDHEGAFSGVDALGIKRGLGYYCDLQSLHSEDAITWSILGTVAHASASEREKWTRDFFSLLLLEDASASGATITLWRRMPHPNTLGPGGPEIDFTVMTENAVVLGEAKWLSPVSTGQGKDKDQIQLRRQLLDTYGGRFFPGRDVRMVVGISLYPDGFTGATQQGAGFRTTTWESVCRIPSHPHADEVRRYVTWKKDHTRPRARPLRPTTIPAPP